jgi:hypothetical protein
MVGNFAFGPSRGRVNGELSARGDHMAGLASPHALAPGLTPRSVLEKFAAAQMIDVHLPTGALRPAGTISGFPLDIRRRASGALLRRYRLDPGTQDFAALIAASRLRPSSPSASAR